MIRGLDMKLIVTQHENPQHPPHDPVNSVTFPKLKPPGLKNFPWTKTHTHDNLKNAMSDKNVSVQSASVRCPNRVPEIEFLIWLLDGSLVIGEDETLGCREYLSWRRGQGASIWWWSICRCTLSIVYVVYIYCQASVPMPNQDEWKTKLDLQSG